MKIEIGIIGGTGIYNLSGLKPVKKIKIKTKYGDPSELIEIYKINDRYIAFLPRHGKDHKIPPHKIPYKANIWALKSLGVKYIFSTSVVGSLKKNIKPGDFIIPDQFINLTWGRDDYFNFDKNIIHLPMEKPYCETLRKLIYKNFKPKNSLHNKGTVVVIQGPRFSTVAESRWFIKQGWDIVNMTQYPEVYFAREMNICYASICSVTDYDVGVNKDIKFNKRGIKRVVNIFKKNTEETQKLILNILNNFNINQICDCQINLEQEYYKQINLKN